MKRCFSIMGILALIVAISGCASAGQKIDRAAVSEIQNGVQSKEQIESAFGQPSHKRTKHSGFYQTQIFLPASMLYPTYTAEAVTDINDWTNECCEQWVYEYEAKKSSKDAGHKEVLVVNFDLDGIVRGYTFNEKYAIGNAKVEELHERTGAPVMDCKKLLSEMDGDMEKSVVELQQQAIAKAENRRR